MAASSIKIALVGPYPPPYGGLSVQIYALNEYLRSKHRCVVINIGESRKEKSDNHINATSPWAFLAKMFLLARSGFILHLFTNGHNAKSWISALVCSLAGLLNGRKTVLTFGSGNIDAFFMNCSKSLKPFVHTTLRLAGVVVCRNEKMRSALMENGAAKEKLVVMAGFPGLPPLEHVPLPSDFQSFRTEHFPLIGAIGSIEPVYGTSLLLESFHHLKEKHPRMGIVLIGLDAVRLRSVDDYANIAPCLYLPGELPHDIALAVMKRLDVFVRPTLFDGDANSVKEALALGVPVVASATAYRPLGVKTFDIGDPIGCAERIEDALKEERTNNSALNPHSSRFQAIERLYTCLNDGLSVATFEAEYHACSK